MAIMLLKNVASGHVNNDDTDNTNAANIADVKEATTTVTANNGEAANATTGNNSYIYYGC